ncbi:MAG: sugar-binding domain-containing protein [Syntrophales bacterium]
MARMDELRLMTKTAHMYYMSYLKQTEIAEQLDISQATTSRLLKRTQEEQIIRINISSPMGIYSDLESLIESNYGIKEAIVVESLPEEKQIMRDLASAAAYYLITTLKPDEVIGISSWSATLLATVDAMMPIIMSNGAQVIQILGGVGNSTVESRALYLVNQLAMLIQGQAILLPVPAVVGALDTRVYYIYKTHSCVKRLTALIALP